MTLTIANRVYVVLFFFVLVIHLVTAHANGKGLSLRLI